MLVFIPLTRAELKLWADSGSLEKHQGYAVTPAMMEAFDFDDPSDEAAEFNALNIAGLAGLLQHRERLVAVCEATAQDLQNEFGEVVVERVPFTAVTALFAADRAIELDAESLSAVWNDAKVQEKLDESPLLWYGPSEVAVLLNLQ